MTDAPGGCQNGLWETGGKIDVETDGGISAAGQWLSCRAGR